MGAVEEILSSIDTHQLAAALGTDEATAQQAAAAAIPTLIAGFQANSDSEDGAAGLLGALDRHAGNGLFADSVDLSAVDTADGQKIVAHALAGDPSRLQAVSGISGSLLSKLLPLLAPIVMSYLAKKLGMGGAASTSGSGSGDLLGDLLGGLLGGAGTASGGGLGDLLGQILGAGAPAAQPPAQSSGYGSGPQAGADGDLGGVFNSPGGGTGMQIPADSDAASAPQPSTSGAGSADILGDLLGQILGR